MPLVLDDRVIFTPWKVGSVTMRVAVLGAGGAQVGGQHGRPADHLDLAGRWYGLHRDPWSWYDSLYRFALQRGMVGNLEAWGGGSLAFRDVLWGWTHPELGRIPPTAGCVFWCGTPSGVASDGRGFCSYAFDWFYSAAPEVERIATADIDQTLAEWGLPVPARENVGRIERQPWTRAMVRWVDEADAAIIEKYGFHR